MRASPAIHSFNNGIKVYKDQLLPAQKERYKSINLHEAEEEPIFIDSLTRIKDRGIYINTGAAIGYYPLLARKVRPDIIVHAYEPLEKHRMFFRDNIELNGFRESDFTIFDEGLYSKAGFISFDKKGYGSMIRSDVEINRCMVPGGTDASRGVIRTVTMEEVCQRAGGQVGLLQMDIQGLEAEVLEFSRNFLSQRQIANLIIGTHSESLHRRCLEVLRHCGYHILLDNFDTLHQPDGILYAAALGETE